MTSFNGRHHRIELSPGGGMVNVVADDANGDVNM